MSANAARTIENGVCERAFTAVGILLGLVVGSFWLGVLGVLVAILTVVLLILRALRVARERFDQDGLGYGIVLGVLGLWTAVAVHNLFDNLYVSHIYLQMAILLGLAAAIGRRRPEEVEA